MTEPTPPPPTGPQPYYGPGYPAGYGYPPPPPPRKRRRWVMPLAIGGGITVMLLVLATCAAVVSSVAGSDGPSASLGAPPSGTATASGTATPTPLLAGGPVQPVFGQPVTVSKDGKNLATVLVSAPDIPPTLVEGIVRPEYGAYFTVFEVKITNISGDTRTFNMFEFYVRSLTGVRFQPTIGAEPQLNSGTLRSGETVTGKIAFDAGEHGKLVYTPGALIGTSVAEWAF